MKRNYTKPTIASERVFSLTSQGCDVNYESPGYCATLAKYSPISCPYSPWKVETEICGEFPQFPVSRS
jgi:hypothetical protein